MIGYVVLDAEKNILEWCDNPWYDGQGCLVDNLNESFTVFFDLKSAKRALSKSKKYAKSQGGITNLAEHWKIDEWKVQMVEIA